MNKKYILSISLILLVGLVVFVSAMNWSTEVGPVRLREGWNIVYGLQTPDQLDGQVLEKSHIKAIYAYIPTTGEYLRAWPNPDSQDWQNLDNVFDDHELLQTAFWVYTDEGANTEYWLYDEPINVEERTMYAGWNFLGITPDMNGKSLNELEGTCNIEKVYHYEALVQDWSPNLANDDFMDEKLTSDSVGLGIVIKVSNDCNLGSGGSSVTPPTIPN